MSKIMEKKTAYASKREISAIDSDNWDLVLGDWYSSIESMEEREREMCLCLFMQTDLILSFCPTSRTKGDSWHVPEDTEVGVIGVMWWWACRAPHSRHEPDPMDIEPRIWCLNKWAPQPLYCMQCTESSVLCSHQSGPPISKIKRLLFFFIFITVQFLH